ncbi:conserved hypothetical protein [Buchnera aphidicola str. Bp (Baizongia pistaciae)]|uniref:Protein TusC n=1 Tax=Buchnera aphidicola subsp. Baizongia pistaciae (strain Bp) TaxID=224915 RepID=TUSC_BUCBP|nr:sulfurtransferase complex subunit TusC [Buchnera aphidicola]Q89A63.1 RecName: Full=Protein TusC; AltName: Full=tRNA 2-thiouridine synthesizing protein C [Buchnera aphidicola str. Bp (Baizongia pistaciae)]AAO27180.1 conserved hypothetical protein [Buchnera aphidicola str. Bp (Baizongia pistaciae)]
MKKIAFVFSYVPHGVSLGREGLDLLLSVSIMNSKISVFFIGDGIFQLLKNQKPDEILSKNYVLSFKILPFFGIYDFFLCNESLKERGLFKKTDFLLDVSILSAIEIRNKLKNSDLIINF